LNDILFDAKTILEKVNDLTSQIDTILRSLSVIYNNISIVEGDQEAKNYYQKFSSRNQTFKNKVECCINLCSTKNIKMDKKILIDLEYFLMNHTRNFDEETFSKLKNDLAKISKNLQ